MPAVDDERAHLIAEIERIVEEACAQDSNVFGYGIWSHHIIQVARNARRLAPLFGADPEIVEVAAILHDYASVKDQALVAEHHLHGAAEAERLLRGFGYPEERIQAVTHCIVAHRASAPLERETPEAECLANADALTHIEQVPSLLHFAFVQQGMGIDEGTEWVRAKLQRSWGKLSPQVQALAQAAYQAALATLDEPAGSH